MAGALAGYRELFPVTRTCHYLNHAAVAPTSTRVREAVQAWVNDLCNHGMDHVADWARDEREVRARAAKLLGASPPTCTAPATTKAMMIT